MYGTTSMARAARPRPRVVRAMGYLTMALAFIALSLTYSPPASAAPGDDPSFADLSQTFSVNPVYVTALSQLRITITNTDLEQHNAMAFVNQLPAGVVASGAQNNGCGAENNLVISAGNRISWSGRIDAGVASCLITVNVRVASPGSYNNSTANFSDLTGLNAPLGATLVVKSTEWEGCPTEGYLFQNKNANVNQPTDVFAVNLVTGAQTSLGQAAHYLNALGWNQADNYIWGWDRTSGRLAKVGRDFSVTLFDIGWQNPAEEAQGYNIGDVDPDGYLTLASTAHNWVVRVDLNTPTPTVDGRYLRGSNPQGMADWAFIDQPGASSDGFYSIAYGDGNAATWGLYFTDERSESVRIADLPQITDATVGVFGAMYADSAGNLYASNNQSGNIYRVDTRAASPVAELFVAEGPDSDGNDGVRCQDAPLPLDFGDAPNSFSTTLSSSGPRSEVVAALKIGATNTPENDGVPGAAANSDRGDDGVVFADGRFGTPFRFIRGNDAVMDVSVTNNLDTPATLVAWVDLNGGGTFTSGERQRVVIPANAGSTTRQFDFGVVPESFPAHTYARFRLIPGDVAAPAPTGPAAFGEVEDYRVTVIDPPPPAVDVSLVKDVVARVNSTDQFELSISNSGQPDQSVTTSTLALGVQPEAAVMTVDAGSAVTFSESGSGQTDLSDYETTYACVDTVLGSTVSSGAGTTVTVTPTAVQQIECTFTNRPAGSAMVTTRKVIVNRAAPTDQFTLAVSGNGEAATQVTSGSAVGLQSQQASREVDAGLSWVFSEAMAGTSIADNYVTTYECVNQGSGAVLHTGTGLTTPAIVAPDGQHIICTFTNRPTQVSVQKNVISRAAPTDQFTVRITGASLSGPGNSVTTSGTQTGAQGLVGPLGVPYGSPITFSEVAAGTTNLAHYGSQYRCVDLANGDSEVAAGSGTSVTYTPTKAQSIRCTFTNTPLPRVNIVKTTPSTAALTGGTVQYLVVVTNTGVVQANGTTVTDAMPTGIASMTWTCAQSAGAVCPAAAGSGAIDQTIAAFPAGGSVTYSVTATVAATALPATITNTAVATPPTGFCGTGTTYAAPPCSSSVDLPVPPTLSITKTTSTAVATPGGIASFAVTVTNLGPSHANGSVVRDPIPTGLTSFDWTCTSTGGAVCPVLSGSGAITHTIAVFPAGGAVTYKIAARVGSNPPASLTNSSSVQPPAGATCAPGNTAPPCVATVTLSPHPVVSIQKTTSSPYVVPSGSIVYAVVVANAGSVPANNLTVSDPIPAGLTSFAWSCEGQGATCPHTSGSGAINEVGVSLPVGARLTYTITASVVADPPANVVNTASVDAPVCAPDLRAGPCSSGVETPSAPIVSIVKTADRAELSPLGTVVYTVRAINVGTSPADGSLLTDAVPVGLEEVRFTCLAAGGAVCPRASGSGSLNEIVATFPAGSSLTYTVTARVLQTPPGVVTNTARLSPPDSGFCAPGNAPPPCSASVSTPTLPAVSIQKRSVSGQVLANTVIVYTIIAANTSGVDAGGAIVTDPLADGMAKYTWTCKTTGGALCVNEKGIGALKETIEFFPPGSSVTFTVSATVSSAPPAIITNTAFVIPPSDEPCTPNGNADPCSDSATALSPALAITGIAVGSLALIGSVGALVGAALLMLQRRRQNRRPSRI